MYRHLLLSALLTVATAGVASAQEIPAAVMKEGDYWKFRGEDQLTRANPPLVYTNRVTKVDGPVATIYGENISTEKVGRFWWTYDMPTAHWRTRHSYSEEAGDKRGALAVDNSRAQPYLDFPLAVGKKWKHREDWKNNAGDTGNTELNAEVAAVEKVRTAAGEFEAYRVEFNGWWKNEKWGTSGRVSRTSWYAPGARRVVKSFAKMADQRGQPMQHTTEEVVEMKLVE